MRRYNVYFDLTQLQQYSKYSDTHPDNILIMSHIIFRFCNHDLVRNVSKMRIRVSTSD